MEPLACPVSWSNNWSISRPTILNLAQIQYRVSDAVTSPDGLILVECINIQEKDASWKPWRVFPAVYRGVLPRILNRLEFFCDVYDAIKDNKAYQKAHPEAFKILRYYIVHTERTLERIWEEVYQAGRARKLTASWRSVTFNGWLIVEHAFRSHMILPSDGLARFQFMSKDPLSFDWAAFDNSCPGWQRTIPTHLDSDEAVREAFMWCQQEAHKLAEYPDSAVASNISFDVGSPIKHKTEDVGPSEIPLKPQLSPLKIGTARSPKKQ